MRIQITDEEHAKYDKRVKQIIVIRTDLKMPAGKACAQVSHASQGAFQAHSYIENNARIIPLKDNEGNLTPLGYWDSTIFKKIVVKVSSEEELIAIYEKALSKGYPCCLIEDSGLTVFKGQKTKTCVGIGPLLDDNFVDLTDHLPLY